MYRFWKAFFKGTVFSRISGLLRDVAMAVSFGSSPEIASFMIAFRLSNVFRRLIGEGNLQGGFIPHFVSLKELGPRFYRDALYTLTIVVLAIVALFVLLLWLACPLMNQEWQKIFHLSMWMAPGLLFICLYSLSSSVLQCQKRYFLPAVSPVLFNVVWALFAFVFKDIQILAIAITLAFFAQCLLPFLATLQRGVDWFQ